MRAFEKVSVYVRHLPLLHNLEWVWSCVRPAYQLVIRSIGRNGLERIVNGSDRMLVCPEVRSISEEYEPNVWRVLMNEIRKDDTFVDVGAFIGLYSIAVGSRLGSSGRVIAFEPDEDNFSLLVKNIRLNGLEGIVEVRQAAVSEADGQFWFLKNHSAVGCLCPPGHENGTRVDVVTLDRVFSGERIDVLKVDVEGYEEKVLQGAHDLLCSSARRPRAIFIEVHPYAWTPLGTTSESLIATLSENGYRVETVEGTPIRSIESYGEIVARI